MSKTDTPWPKRAVARRRKFTLASAAFALVTSTLAGLLGAAPSANAEDNNPTFYLDGGNGAQNYINFINDIRSRVSDNNGSQVPGAGWSYQVNHTVNVSTRDSNDFIRVDVHAMGSPEYVRIQLRRSDLYMVGWWGRDGVYRYIGTQTRDGQDQNQDSGPSSRYGDGGPNDHIHYPTGFTDNYNSIEAAAQQGRAGLAINPWTVNGAVHYLLEAGDRQRMAQGVLMMTQWISEAARFRPLRDEIALVMNDNGNYFRIPQEYADQENNWGNLSNHFNNLLRQPQGARDPQPLEGWGRIANGRPLRYTLTTAVAYAQYVLSTSNQR
ncbi:ribosome-inactivating family protein [Lentzea sp. NPDC004782]|uniref:ribosome-inactivating family protein n=1 Tax=Lentzea sp. NPDC004782 TaxID=3154458 RepID=UPI0033B776D5